MLATLRRFGLVIPLMVFIFGLSACTDDDQTGIETCDESTCLNGTCEGGSCVCTPGHEGDDCSQCEEGYQDNDGDGVCLPSCDMAELGDCGGNGSCDDSSGEAICDCEDGYQDDDGDGVCEANCEALDCGENQVCDTSDGPAQCVCAEGYEGDECDECAEGYQDNDEDGVCLASCETAELECSDGCDDSSGEAKCSCPVGYEGSDCEDCSEGYQDNDDNGSCLPTCDAGSIDCGANGSCDDSSGEATCDCGEGYEGDDCGSCTEGYQDNDEDGVCMPTCTDDACVNGTCDDSSGEILCQCDAGYAGSTCALCADGYQDNDHDGVCAANCETAGLTCEVGVCTDISGEAICACSTGYTGEACDECAEGYQDNDSDGECLLACSDENPMCGEHGVCDDATGAMLCICDAEYAGSRCQNCASGYQDNDDDGLCTVNCAGMACGGNSSCDDSSGTAICACAEGYAGTDCTDCAAGYQDNDSNGSCLVDCSNSALDCGSHGSCSDSDGTAGCACDTGYTGSECSYCAGGYQDNDSNGSCELACSASSCTSNAVCDDSSGSITCECAEGYTGSDCSSCASGYQDNDSNGSCLPSCATTGYSCSGHGYCSDASGSAVCVCDSGYIPNGSGECLIEGSGEDCSSPLLLDLSQSVVTGSNVGFSDSVDPSCQDNTGADVVYFFTLTQPMEVTFETSGFDTVLHLWDSCGGNEIACDDDGGDASLASYISEELDAGTYFLYVDGYSDTTGSYSLYIDLGCGTGYIFDTATSSCVPDPCIPNPCTDANQNVCEALSATSYSCDCNAGYIPDGYGGCTVNTNPTGETCADPIPLSGDSGTVSGTNSGSSDIDVCMGEGPELVYAFTLTDAARVELTTAGYDTVLSLREDCMGSAIECNDDYTGIGGPSQIIAELSAGSYYVIVDSYSTSGGSFSLDYSFQSDPCAGDPCPGIPECVANSDWSDYSCICPDGYLPYGSDCVDDPCEPNPCSAEPDKNRCEVSLPSSYTCECNLGYIDDGYGGCMLDPDADEWTFIVYLNADNNLDSDGVDDINEMAAAAASMDVHIVVLMDRYDYGAYTYYVEDGNQTIIEDHGEIDMSDWQVMRDFGVWAIQNYPARHYAFIAWDHGEGWRAAPAPGTFKAFSNDDHGSAEEISISNGDYAAALEAMVTARGGKLDIVGFDACLMGMWEVAAATEPYADYLVASSETEPAAGWPYDDFLPDLVNSCATTNPWTPEDLGTAIVQAYNNESSDNATLSLTDLNNVPALTEAVDELAIAMINDSSHRSAFASAASNSQSFYYSDYIDLYDFAYNVSNISGINYDVLDAAYNVMNAVEDAVVIALWQNGAWDTYDDYNGLSIYFPQYGADAEYDDAGAVWSAQTHWDEFLDTL